MMNSKRLGSGRQILVVDDDSSVSGAIKMMFMHDGHSVQTAISGEEALSLLEREKFDAVITDYSMPDMKGDALAVAIKQRLPNQPVIMITAHADALKASGNPLPGVDCLISKPFLLADLRKGLASVLPENKKSLERELVSTHQTGDGGSS